MLSFSSSGEWKATQTYLDALAKENPFSDLDHYGQMGVEALSRMTPVESGLSAKSWGYRITKDANSTSIEWYNTNIDEAGTPVVILLQYGHGTGTDGYVAGRDFINPAMQPLFDQIADEVWKKVIT